MIPAADGSAPHPLPASPPRILAIVVSYNSSRELAACLRSLEAQRGGSPRIHLVDNASGDGGAATARREFPDVRVTQNRRNAGFGAAMNQVLETEAAEFYALVNPDTVLPPGAIPTCVEYLERHPDAGIVATRLVGPDGVTQPSCHSFLGLRNLLGETFGIHRLLPGLRPLSSLHMSWFAHDRVADVDWIQGAFLVARGEAVRAVGGFDPEFFMYGEEMDWCRRIRRAGWKIVFLPEPPVVHLGGASTTPIAGLMFVENLKGRVRFLRKHRGPVVALAARGLIALSVALRFLWRETRGAGASLAGREADAPLRSDRARFRAAMRWVLRGLPLTPPEFESPKSILR